LTRAGAESHYKDGFNNNLAGFDDKIRPLLTDQGEDQKMQRIGSLTILLLAALLVAGPAFAELQHELVKRQPLDKTPLVVAQSVSDGRLFVLLEGGVVQIFSPEGQPQERFEVDAAVTTLEVSPDGQRLYLGNGQRNELQIIDLSIVHDLPVGNSAVKGPANAPVTITVFDDFQCPYCARLAPVLAKVLETYPTQVRLVFKHFPLSMHTFARQAAMASIAARRQDKFWPLHDLLFANYNTLDEAKIRELAESAGLDMARFDKDLQDPALAQEVSADMQLGARVGVRGTPSVFVNGVLLKDRSMNGFQRAIQAGLE
jgi:protein-disulfide isomerase